MLHFTSVGAAVGDGAGSAAVTATIAGVTSQPAQVTVHM
jgi:hypothetical protein